MASNSARRLCLAIAAVFAAELRAAAFENHCSHPEMVHKAIAALVAPGFGELSRYDFDISTGSYKEDLGLNVIHHFYNPRNDQPLRVVGANAFLAIFNESARSRAFRFYEGAIGAYGDGPNGRKDAYELLGRAAHLLQDVHQPSHVHNDPHVPEHTPLEILGAGYEGLDAAQLESLVESGCPSVVPGASAGSFVGRSFEDFFTAEAMTTYRMTALSGQLPPAKVGATGFVRVGEVDILASFVRPKSGFSDKCRTQQHWELDVDPARPLCYNPAVRYDGPARGGYDNDWWELLVDGDIRTFLTPGQHFYIEASTDPLTREVTLPYVQGLQADHLPRAVANTTVLLKMFAAEVDGRPPFLGLTKPNGDPLPSLGSGSVTDTPDIVVAALDAGFPGFPPSGVYRVQVVRVPSEQIAYENAIANGDSGEVVRSVSGLGDGTYEVRAYDGLGNVGRQTLVVDANGGPKAVAPPDPDPNDPPGPFPQPTPGLGVVIDANTGASGQACAGPGAAGHKPVCVRTLAGTEKCYPAPQNSLCITWACSSPGTYDIPVNFQDDRGIWARTHTVHCHDAPPTIKVCSADRPCQEISLPPNFDPAANTINAVIEEGTPYCGLSQACSIIEQIGGGKCEMVHGGGGCTGIRSSRAYPRASVAAAGMFYDPPDNANFLRNQPFTLNFNLNNAIGLVSFTYPKHGHQSAMVRMPALGQPWKNCANDGQTCLAGGGSGGSGGPPAWGSGPPPTPDPNPVTAPPQPNAPAPPPDPMRQAAAAMGRAILGGTIRVGNAATLFGTALTLTSGVKVPPYQPTAGAQACRWTGATWGCEGPATASCAGGACVMSASLLHASTWAFLAPLPASYPDLTAPSISAIEVSQDGAVWSAPGTLIQTTNPSVRLTARDPPSGIELVSGIAVSSAPLPFTSTDPALVLHLHLDEGSGSQLFDSSLNYSTGTINLTPVWVPGRFGSALEFNGLGGQQASAPVATRVDSGPFSIEAWVYPTDNTSNRRIANKGTAFSRYFDFLVANGRLQAGLGDGSVGYTVTSGETLPLNQWSLVAMSFDGTKLRIFANGEQKGEIPASYAGSDPAVIIGSGWRGRIDEFRILSRAIGRAEAALDYRRGFAVLATGDDWRTSRLATQYDYGGLSEGQAGPAVLTASGFSLARSTYAVHIELAVADVEGHFTSSVFQVPVAPADTTPLAFSGAEVSSNTAVWFPHGAVQLPGPAAFRVMVKDPVLGDALRSGIATSTQAAPFTAIPNTLLLLHLDEGSGVPLDSSGNGFVMSAQNGPAWVAGRFGGALQFNSDYQYLLPSGSPAGLDVPNWTASVWVYPTETANGFFISKSNDCRYGFYMRAVGGRPSVTVNNSVNCNTTGGVTVTAPDILPLNQWTSVTATSDRSVIRLYVNGELKASAPGYMDLNSAAFVVGANNGGPPFWRGRLDEIRYMNRPQGPEEVLLDYRRGYAALFSSNGGASWTAPVLSYGSAVQGDLDATLSVSSLALADSVTSNILRLFASDGAGNTSSATYVLPAAFDTTAPASPVIVSTQLVSNGAVAIAWQHAPGEVPVSYSLYRATEPIVSLAGLPPVATMSASNMLDTPSATFGDVLYYALTATDLQGNVSVPSASVRTLFDHAPPVTTLAVQGSSTTVSGIIYALPSSTLTLSAIDHGSAISGVAAVALTVDGFPVAASTAPFQLAAGLHHVSYFSTDAAGNAETPRISTVAVDATAPVSTFAVTGGGSRDSLDRVIIVAGQTIVLSAQDAAAGVLRIFYRIDSGTWTVAASPVTIPEGQHVLQFYAVDMLDNAEAPRSQSFVVALAPTSGVSVAHIAQSSFTVLWSSMTNAAGYVVVVSSTPDFSAVAFSTAVQTQQVVVTGLRASTTYFVRVAFFSDSNDGLPVVVSAFTMNTPAAPLDGDPPRTTLVVGDPQFGSTTPFVTTRTPLSLGVSEPARTFFAVDSSTFAAYSGTFTLAAFGMHMIQFYSIDLAGNVEETRGVQLAVDGLPPRTTAYFGEPKFAGSRLYLSSTTPIQFTAADDLAVIGDGRGAGAAQTLLSVDSAAFAAVVSTVVLPSEGAHALSWFSRDSVGNAEPVASVPVAVDLTPSLTRMVIVGPSVVQASGTVVGPGTTLSLSAVDPVSSGVASGLAFTRWQDNGGAFSAYVSSFALTEGSHILTFQSQDNVGNLEVLKSAAILVDATPPASALAIGAPNFDPGAGQPVFVAAATLLSLSAHDPVVQNVTSDVRDISLRRGGEPFGIYSAPFALPLPDGLKTLDYFATDNVGNQEAPRSTAVALDDTPPLTTLVVLGGRQFPGPDAASFYASSDTRLALPAVDPVAGGVASGLALTRWQDNSGPFQAFAAALVLAEGRHVIAYQSQDRVLNMEVPRSTAVLVDAAPPVSFAAIDAPLFVAADGTSYVTPATPVRLSAVDPALPTGQPGSGVSRIEVAVDGGPFTAYSAALTLAEGRHTILYRAVDNVANVEVVRTLQVRSDATPPVSSLIVGAPQFQLPSVLLVSTRTPFEVASLDPVVSAVASGVKDVSFRVSDPAPGAGAFATFAAPFTMTGADANKIIEFFSRDNVLNTEVVKSSAVLLDSTPPAVALLSPASCGAGICRVLKGKFPVLGTARDLHFASYRLEFAPGQDAAAGFVLISSGALAVSSGTLGTWDAAALSGWFTVRLSAADLVANTASAALNVFVGDPGQLLALGNHEIFGMPEGVAVGGDGKIYVADRSNDRIAVFSSTGALLASWGGRKDDADADDHGTHKESTTTVRLNKPSGVAVDAAGNVYVADTNRDRVLKLSASGQVLLSLGQFHHPAGVAVDAASNIYVADTGNRRVRIFNSTGAFRFQFDLPPVPARLDQDDDEKGDDDDAASARLGKPFGIAVDAAGHIYVADPKGGRALKFGAAGELLMTIPILGEKPGTFGQPFGVAVSAGGDCLLVSDRKTSRILKFDFLGNSNLVFASKGKIDDDASAPGGTIVLKKPMGLALDAQGSLFVADRNNDRIRKFGLPTGQAQLVVPASKPEDDHIARGVVDAEDGGKVERRDRAAVHIPAGAVAADLKVTVSTPAFSVVDDSNRRRAAEDARLKIASPPVEYGPEGTKFKGPVTLTLPYSPELIALQKIDAKDLTVRYWNRDKSKWEDLESTVDPKTRTVKAKTTHFSLYQVFSGTVSAAAIAPLAADAAFAFRDAYAFPNPARGSGPVTIRIQTGLADSVEVRVYDVSGRKIHSSSNFSLDPNLDDGNGKGAQYTYDHAWDVSGAGSGVYQYVITAKKAGQSDIHKTGRVGVVK